ncbi:MAG: hypothetical protein NXI19_21420 [Alphaproteobacteria bacterium]|nr:hypothetical protein [Alphaproteobacteria bacterium]
MSIDEVGLQSPVVDPIDLITFGGVVAVSIRKALQLIGRAASLHASGEGVGILLKEEALRRLRSAFTSSPKVQFKFTQKTLKHMRTPVISTPVSRQETCRARSGLSEGMYVDCELFWPDRSAKPRNLSERLTGSLGLDLTCSPESSAS